MQNNRPKIEVPFQTIDVLIELLSITLIILSWVFVSLEFNALPDTIASHFNGKGQPDGYSSKSFILILPILATLMYIGLFILNKFPHMHNYMVNISEDNALKNYRFSTRVLRIVNFFVVLLFSYITYTIISSAKGNTLTLGKWFLPVVISVSVILPIGLIVYQRKINKS